MSTGRSIWRKMGCLLQQGAKLDHHLPLPPCFHCLLSVCDDELRQTDRFSGEGTRLNQALIAEKSSISKSWKDSTFDNIGYDGHVLQPLLLCNYAFEDCTGVDLLWHFNGLLRGGRNPEAMFFCHLISTQEQSVSSAARKTCGPRYGRENVRSASGGRAPWAYGGTQLKMSCGSEGMYRGTVNNHLL